MNSPKRTKRIVGASQRRAEIMIATLFLVTGVVSILAVIVLNPILNASNYLAQVFPNKGAVEWGSLLWSINNIGIVFIAVFAFPLLRKLDEALATGYLASRIIEGTIMMVGIVATLLLIPLSQEFLKAGAPQGSWFLSFGDVLKQASYLGLTEISSSAARPGWIDLYLAVVPVPTCSTAYLCVWFDQLRSGVCRQHCWLVRSCRRLGGGPSDVPRPSRRSVRDHRSAPLAVFQGLQDAGSAEHPRRGVNTTAHRRRPGEGPPPGAECRLSDKVH